MKKFIMFSIVMVLAVFLGYNYLFLARNKVSTYTDDGISYISKVDSKSFYVYRYGKWEKSFIKGVNIGAAKPGSFPGELAITKEEYLRWFKEIAAMNADSIRVYTILKPEFYDALYEYNRTAVKPLYIFQGVWVNEEDIAKFNDAHNPAIKNGFEEDIKSLIDIIHGNAKLPDKKGHASGTYTKDVSPYVVGWILGIEWDPNLVENTNKVNKNLTSYKGKYLYTENASPFEVFLGETGDYTIQYEMEKYKMQRPVSFTNWVTTDTLRHPNEPLDKEDMAEVNTEHIKKLDTFKPGLFASYHIYPYYPDSMNYQHEYAAYKDSDGKVNTYKAYLKDLIKEHTVPVLVAEFGIPASRGMAHRSIYMGYNQGNVDEKSQGYMDVSMLKDIYDTGYAGGLVFTWQDEWFKRTWNTMDLDVADKRAYWSNTQTNEQEFGLMAFDPGEKNSVCYVDGDISEWKKDKPLVNDNNLKLYAKSDEKYLYLMAQVKDFDFNKDKLLIPIDITPKSGNLKDLNYNVEFKRPTDMVIQLDKEKGSRITVDSYYDSFYYMYSHKATKSNGEPMLSRNSSYENKNSSIFNAMYLCLNRELFLPQDKKELPLESYETGKLVEGNGNPDSKNFNSLTDFYINKENIEIRIPWQLLNVMDPSSKLIMDDFYEKSGVSPLKISGLYAGGIVIRGNSVLVNSDMKLYSWKQWDIPTYHERLKPSYYILKDEFKKIGN
ncbi:family 2 glycosyl transferase [Clostridium manihotivorum]|uniref:Family 2 glycosyl transferase n=1 Tax=Clostridium manihotivorum TaxID=2320868 RepID=A0A3R5R1D2_9CLOT|nr:family 2 glycosyl transferase [Clostridium manihotivorum]QAA34473.1 family 2 glycosyl transferase [Clostridium manihotivorum]